MHTAAMNLLRTLTPLGLFALAVACGGQAAPTQPSAADSIVRAGGAYGTVVRASSCWLGGLWSDAMGEKGDARLAGIEARCRDLMQDSGMAGEEYYPLRALDDKSVDKVASIVKTAAEGDAADAPNAASLDLLVRAFAEAARETVHARRAADKVKEDYKTQAATDVRVADKIAAAPELREGSGLHKLITAEAGPYASTAHLLGLLEALDRMEISDGLPKHLKIYAVGNAFQDVFQKPAPVVPDDASLPIKTGTWLTYLVDVAAAAGHPVPAEVTNVTDREAAAWCGVLLGFADRLREANAKTPRGNAGAALDKLVDAIVVRLNKQWDNESKVLEAHKANK